MTTLIEKLIVGVIGLITIPFIASGVASCASHKSRNNYTAVVTDTIVKRGGTSFGCVNKEGSDKFLVFTRQGEDGKGEVRVFENSDSWIEGKYNSSDVQASLQRGSVYEFETYGWRIPILSWYENVVKAREFKKEDSEDKK